MPQYHFGIGGLFLTPSGANPTPVQVGVLSDVSLDLAYDLKELRGQYQVAVDVAISSLKITGKAKNAAISSGLMAAVLAGETVTTGSKVGIIGETGTIPGTPYQITVAQGATYYEDLGVVDYTAAKQLTRVAAGPTTGQYMVNTGTGQYTFAAADTTHNLGFSYAYTAAAVGKTVSLNNLLMQQGTAFTLCVYNKYGGKGLGWRFPAVYIPKLSLALKAEAYTEQDIEFFVAQDTASTKVLDLYTDE